MNVQNSQKFVVKMQLVQTVWEVLSAGNNSINLCIEVFYE